MAIGDDAVAWAIRPVLATAAAGAAASAVATIILAILEAGNRIAFGWHFQVSAAIEIVIIWQDGRITRAATGDITRFDRVNELGCHENQQFDLVDRVFHFPERDANESAYQRGTICRVLPSRLRSCTRPASANVCRPALAAVSTCRTVKAGTVKPPVPGMTTPRRHQLANSRPNFEPDVAVTEHDRQEVDLRAEWLVLDGGGTQARGTTMGNSPPTLNWAGRPLTAARFGSARILATLFCWTQSMNPKNA